MNILTAGIRSPQALPGDAIGIWLARRASAFSASPNGDSTAGLSCILNPVCSADLAVVLVHVPSIGTTFSLLLSSNVAGGTKGIF